MNIAGVAPDFARFYPISYQVTRFDIAVI